MNLLGLVLPGWAKWLAIAVASLALYGFGRIDGTRIEGAKLADFKAAQATASVRALAARVQVLHDVEVKYVERQARIIKQVETVEKEVRVYVTQDDDDRCRINAGFLRVHDAAFSGDDPPVAGESDRADSGLALSQVSETIAYNAGLCRQWKEQAVALKQAYELVRTAEGR